MDAPAEQVGKELPNIVNIVASMLKNTALSKYLLSFESVIFTWIVVIFLVCVFFIVSRRLTLIPGKLQSFFEVIVGGLDDFVCAVLGEKGRKYTPFIGTLFLYILTMNLLGMVPLFKSPTTSWSTTLPLGLAVFFYVQYSAFKELGVIKYADHLCGNQRGFLMWSIVLPVFMFFLHVITELVKPVTLSLRLRSNVWGDDLLLAILAGFGLTGLPLMLFSFLLAFIAALVQALVFCLLTTVYFAMVMPHDGDHVVS